MGSSNLSGSAISLVGTMPYVSPQRYDNINNKTNIKIDEEKNDVFAVGVMCVEMLGFSINGLNKD